MCHTGNPLGVRVRSRRQELFPTPVRAKAMALGMFLNWLSDYAVVGSWLSLTELCGGPGGGLMAYDGVNLAAVAFFFLCVPETGGRSLEDTGSALA